MDRLQKISPSTSTKNVTADVTPKRSLFSRLMTPLNMITEENGQKIQISSPLRNPFDVRAEALYLPAFSPSVFDKISEPKKNDGSFRWSIDQVSNLYPADIDDSTLPEPWIDAEQDLKVQKAIDTYFSQNSIVPSPWSSSPKEGKGGIRIRRRTRIQDSLISDVPKCEATTQTMLSIPPNVDLRDILGEYFTFNCDGETSSNNSQDEVDVMSSSSLRRKLFALDDEYLSPSKEENNYHPAKRWSTCTMRSVTSTPASDMLSSSPISPPNCSDSCNIIESPPVSPIKCSLADKAAELTDEGSFAEHENDTEPSFTLSKKKSLIMEMTGDSAMSFGTESQCAVTSTWFGSKHADTGYVTGSISSSQSMTASDTNYGYVSRITPVAELMEGFELSSSTTCDMSYKMDSTSIGNVSSFDLQKKAPILGDSEKKYQWIPTCCSTPTKCSHSQIDRRRSN